MLPTNNFGQEKYSQQKTNSLERRNNHKVFYFVGIVIFIFFISILIFFIAKSSRSNLNSKLQPTKIPTNTEVTQINKVPSNAVEKVGNETIYQDELQAEYADYPSAKNAAVAKQLLAKIARDSIILQAGSANGLITLNSSVFNSPNVDYKKRIELVKSVQDSITSNENKLVGSFISLWFDNVTPGPAGYAQGKQIAYAAISQIYKQVKENKMTMTQAAQAIKNNSQLAQVDPQYKSNAIADFAADSSKKITFNPSFDKMIRALSPGQITSLYLAKDKDGSGERVDAVYMFAQITTKSTSGQNENFDQWYAKQEPHYEITIY